MTIMIERDALLGAVQHVVGAVPSRSTIPVLLNMLIEAEGSELRATGTDLDIYVTQRAEMEPIAEPFTTTISAIKLLAAAQSLKPGKVKIERGSGGTVTLRQGRSVRTMATIAATDFPKPQEEAQRCSFTLPASALLRMLAVPSHAASTEETRYYLNGVYIHVVDGEMRAAATDGLRLVRASMSMPDGADGLAKEGIIVPLKTIKLLTKALGKADSAVQVSIADRRMSFAFGNTHVVSKLVEGTFPAYDRVIPIDGMHVLRIARDALIEPVAAVQAIVSAEGEDRSRAVAVSLGARDEDHEVSARDTSGALASEPLDAEVEGAPIRIGFNGQFLVGLAGLFAESGRLTLRVADVRAAMKITSDKDPDLIAVLMPRSL